MNKDPLSLDLRHMPTSRRYAGIWVGVATVMVATATLFCETHLTAVPIEQTLMTAAVVILSCFIMYTSLFDAGHEHAEDGEDYRAVLTAYHAARDAARPHLRDLEDFCRAWSEEELSESRRHLLDEVGLDISYFVRYRDDTIPKEEWRCLPRIKRRALVRAAKLKPITLHATMLLSGGRGARRAPMLSTRPARIKRAATALVPTVIGSLITVAVTLESMEMTPAAIISGILRIFTIVWCGVRGYSTGVRAVSEDDTLVLESKMALLTVFTNRANEKQNDMQKTCPSV